MVINKFGDQLYNGLEETIIKHLQNIEQKIEAAQGESFLRELKLRWDHHNKSMQMIRDILMVNTCLLAATSCCKAMQLALKFLPRKLQPCLPVSAVHGPYLRQASAESSCPSAGFGQMARCCDTQQANIRAPTWNTSGAGPQRTYRRCHRQSPHALNHNGKVVTETWLRSYPHYHKCQQQHRCT